MINSRLAFNQYTTAKHILERYINGRYDENNNWVDESYSPRIPFRCTAIAYGDRDSGVAGQTLKATEVGERYPAFMKVHSRLEMPMKSRITIYGIQYKVVSVFDFDDSGFYKVIAAKTLEK